MPCLIPAGPLHSCQQPSCVGQDLPSLNLKAASSQPPPAAAGHAQPDSLAKASSGSRGPPLVASMGSSISSNMLPQAASAPTRVVPAQTDALVVACSPACDLVDSQVSYSPHVAHASSCWSMAMHMHDHCSCTMSGPLSACQPACLVADARWPQDLLPQVLGRLGFEDLCRSSLVCRTWRNVANSPQFWRHVSLQGCYVPAKQVTFPAAGADQDGTGC